MDAGREREREVKGKKRSCEGETLLTDVYHTLPELNCPVNTRFWGTRLRIRKKLDLTAYLLLHTILTSLEIHFQSTRSK